MEKFPPLDTKTAEFLREVCQALEKNAEWMDTPEGREYLRTPRAQPADDRWHTPDVKPSQFLIPSGRCLVKYKHGGYDTWGIRSPAWNNPTNISFWMPVPLPPGEERLDGPPVVSTETRTRRGNQIRDVVMGAIENRPLPTAVRPPSSSPAEVEPERWPDGMGDVIHTTTEPPRTHAIPNPAPVDNSFIARARRAYEELRESRRGN